MTLPLCLVLDQPNAGRTAPKQSPPFVLYPSQVIVLYLVHVRRWQSMVGFYHNLVVVVAVVVVLPSSLL